MSKEEILNDIISRQEPVSSDKIGEQIFIATMQAMDTYAQEIAVGFAEHLINMMKIQCTTEHMTDLFQKFLTNKNEKK